MFMSSDAANAADRIACDSEEYGDFAASFVEEVIMELQEFLEGLKHE